MSETTLTITPELIRRHDRPGPRYTSYPTADRFHGGIDEQAYRAALGRAAQRPDAPLALYLHLPFCRSLCLYCGCSVYITKSESRMARYLRYLEREMDLVQAELGERRTVTQLHLGGGTPNYHAPEDLAALVGAIRARFDVTPDCELAIEVDPRHASEAQIAALAEIGFNRLSMGVQDLDPVVQQAIGRVQTREETALVAREARRNGFRSVNMDLIYGLPFQTVERFRATIESVLELRPDRVALYSFAWVPWLKRQQTKLDEAALPDADTKVSLYTLARTMFEEAGYVTIGMDHFALPEDELSEALRAGRLRRNFQGYTTLSTDDVVAFGVTGIGDVGGTWVQNTRDLEAWERALDAGRLPVERGWERSGEDDVRRFVIHELMCNFRITDEDLVPRFGRALASFPTELGALRVLADEGLVELVGPADAVHEVRVTPLGRLFVRVVALPFDEHLRNAPPQRPAYSRTI